MTARVTIGVPVYNGAASLERAIASIEAQSLNDFTVIAADNASTDGSWDILQAWAKRDRRVTIHRHADNIGAQANFRYLLDAAETRRFLWHACDDWASPNYLECLDALLDAYPHCALACGDVVKHTVEGAEKRRRFPGLAGLSRLARALTLLKRPRAPWIYGLFRTDDLRRAQAAADRFGYAWGGDYVALMGLILEGRVCGTNDAEFHYRMSTPATQPYRPVDRAAHWRFFRAYLAANLRVLADARIPLSHKALCLPVLLRHVLRAIR